MACAATLRRFGRIGRPLPNATTISKSTPEFQPACAVSSDSPVLQVLAAAAGVLRAAGDRWFLFGAQAVTIWGRPRMSADIDLTADIADPPDRFVAAMLEAGFGLRVPDWEGLFARTRVLLFLHRGSQIPLDIVVAGPGLEQEFLDRAVRVSMPGLVIPVISPEDLVITKILASRSKDVEDVRGILKERGDELDLNRVRSVLGMLEKTLSRSDLSRQFESLLR
jgi:hypothetical protein